MKIFFILWVIHAGDYAYPIDTFEDLKDCKKEAVARQPKYLGKPVLACLPSNVKPDDDDDDDHRKKK